LATGQTISPKILVTALATNRVSLLPDLRGTMTVPTTLTTVLSTSSAPAAAARSRTAIGAVISHPWSSFASRVSVSREVYSGAGGGRVGVFSPASNDLHRQRGVTARADGQRVLIDTRGWSDPVWPSDRTVLELPGYP
jgi:hypothetical protein